MTMSNLTTFKLPKGQILWETKWNKSGELLYFVTSNADRSKYFKYGLDEAGNAIKISTAAKPTDL